MQKSPSILRTVVLAVACAGATGCASNPVNWTMLEPHKPATHATAVGINAEGAAWFFQCDQQSLFSGLRLPAVAAPDGSETRVRIKFDAEPAEESVWLVDQNTYIARGDFATQLARRAALAYNAIVDVDGVPTKFALTGSHNAMIAMTRDCPYLDVK